MEGYIWAEEWIVIRSQSSCHVDLAVGLQSAEMEVLGHVASGTAFGLRAVLLQEVSSPNTHSSHLDFASISHLVIRRFLQ